MIRRIRATFAAFPRQFWMIAFGVLFSSGGSSMVLPFQFIYISRTLGMQLSTVATLITLAAGTGLAVSFLGGSLADRFGRKPVMLGAQAAFGLSWLLMSLARSYLGFLLPMAVMAAAQPIYAVGSDAMMADMIPPEQRSTGYSILRMASNTGFALGPGVGGFIVSRSYTLGFHCAGAAMLTYSLFLALFVRETLRHRQHPAAAASRAVPPGRLGGYERVLRDRGYMIFAAVVTLGTYGVVYFAITYWMRVEECARVLRRLPSVGTSAGAAR